MLNTRRKQGWHREDIRAELRKRGQPFSVIGRRIGYRDANTPNKVLWKRWPYMEAIVASILGVHPSDIWPDRYKLDGSPVGRGPSKGVGKAYPKLPVAGNSQSAGAA